MATPYVGLRMGSRRSSSILDACRGPLVAGVLRDELHGAGAVQGDQSDEVVQPGGLDLAQRFAHAARFELEHPLGVPLGQHAVGGGVVERDGLDVEVRLPARADDRDGAVDDVQVAQAEEVHLEQAELLHVGHGHLGDHLGVALLHEGQMVGERALGDDHAGGVDGVLADEALERPGHVDDLADHVFGVVGLAKVALRVGQAGLEGDVEHLGHQLGDAVGLAVGDVHDPGGVADGLPGLDGAERGDLRHPVAPVLVGHVLDHLLPAAHREVDVDVGHADAVGVEEALEQQVVADGVEIGDAQQVGDQGAGGRAPARAHGDARLFRVADEVPDDEEVGREAHLLDHGQLALQPLADLRRDLVAVAADQPLLALVAQVRGLVVALGDGEVRDEHLLELDVDVAALGDLEGVGDGLRVVAERVQHLLFALEEELLGGEAHAVLLRQPRPGLDAEQHVVGARRRIRADSARRWWPPA